MKKILLTLFIITMCSLTSKPIGLEHGILWRISGNGLTKPSYIFGTNHVFSEKILDSIPGFYKVFDSVESVVGEVNLVDAKSSLEAIKYFSSPSAKMPIDTTYRDILSKKDLQLVDSFFLQYLHCKSNRVYIRPNIANTFIALMILQKYMPKAYLNINGTLDGYIRNKAITDGKEVDGLESFDEQMKIAYGKGSNLKAEAKMLINFIDFLPDYCESFKQTIRAYQNQDLNAIKENYDKKINTGFKLEEDSIRNKTRSDELLKNRNLRWMKKLDNLINKKPTLIEVGVMHLVGEYGLINQFRILGYNVNPVRE
jgi:uncharacterized protein YbaP (TraB family)